MASIEPEHVLLGLIRGDERLTSRIFGRAHLSLEHMRTEIAARTGVNKALGTSVPIPCSAETTRILRRAAEEADRLLHRHIGTGHLLLAILGDHESVATVILGAQGMHRHTLRDDLVQFLNEEAM